MKIKISHGLYFERLSARISKAAGHTSTVLASFLVVFIWAAAGPFAHFSERWQLLINTGTTIITFLMVFLIQRGQNKESRAIHLKLNELIAAKKFARNRLICAEDLTEEELRTLRRYYSRLNELKQKEKDLQLSHAMQEAEKHAKYKSGKNRKADRARAAI